MTARLPAQATDDATALAVRTQLAEVTRERDAAIARAEALEQAARAVDVVPGLQWVVAPDLREALCALCRALPRGAP